MGRLLAAVALLVGMVVGAAPVAVAAEPSVTAEGAVLWDPFDDRVLWGTNETGHLRPASTTKIMTVLLALEAGAIDDTVTVSAEAAAVGRRPGAATLNLRPGQSIAMRSLLQGLLLRSGNDAAVAVAEHLSGSETAFVEKMNARAQELGLTDTHFINATGLTDDLDHHTSALDLARLAEVALRNDDFAEWAAAQTLDVESLGSLTNRNLLLGRYEGANGVKTGYTALAGLCLVASAERDGRQLIGVVLNSDDSTTEGSFIDATAVLDHGFDDFRLARPLRRQQPALRYRWSDASVPLVADEALARTVAATDRVRWQVTVDPLAELPIEQGQPLGSATLVVDGAEVDSTPLVAKRSVGSGTLQTATSGAGAVLQDTLRAFARTAVINRPDDAAPTTGGT